MRSFSDILTRCNDFFMSFNTTWCILVSKRHRLRRVMDKMGCLVRMTTVTLLLCAELGRKDLWVDAPLFIVHFFTDCPPKNGLNYPNRGRAQTLIRNWQAKLLFEKHNLTISLMLTHGYISNTHMVFRSHSNDSFQGTVTIWYWTITISVVYSTTLYNSKNTAPRKEWRLEGSSRLNSI